MIYSPSQTKSFLECPTKRMLSQEGFTSRIVGLRDWVAWVGQGVHAGLAYMHARSFKSPVTDVFTWDPVCAGLAEFQAHYNHAISQGRIIPNTFYVSEAKANIERCLEYAMKTDLLPTGFEVESTEQSLGDYNCILDVVGKKNGKPTFIDWKIKNRLRLDYLDQELEKYRYDWKEARHYPWALSQVAGQRVEEYSVIMFILQPFKVVTRTYQVNWPVVERWAKGCQGVDSNDMDKPYEAGLWEVMSGGTGVAGCCVPIDIPVWQSNMCYPPMGLPCEYLDACWTYDLDREKMRAGGFVQIQRLNKQTLATSQEE